MHSNPSLKLKGKEAAVNYGFKSSGGSFPEILTCGFEGRSNIFAIINPAITPINIISDISTIADIAIDQAKKSI